ncbi:MAG: hypothetical protein HYZ34_00605 [Ignavibacteriae bacterium]|nr:hypothetical protein [Ignavibacteriota bacterium]
MNRIIFFCIILCFSLSTLHAGVLNVPSQYSTIQSAILASANGDTVLVAPGTYFENLNFRGKRIVLTSLYAIGQNTMYIDSTIINGSQPIDPDTASCVIFESGEDTTAVLQGFTLTGGKGTIYRDIHSGGFFREGGGILIEFSSPTIKNNIIKYNEAMDMTGLSSSGGGGIRIGDSYPRIYNNIIMYNKGRYGSAIVMYFTGAILKNNVIYRNSEAHAFSGGAIWAVSPGLTPKVFENNTVVENSATQDVGGIYLQNTSIAIRNCIVWGNTSPTASQIVSSGGSVSITYCNVQGGWSGTGNTNVNPMFVDTSHYLSPASPCVDAGNPASSYNDTEDESNPGFAKNPSRGTVRNDMGAYGGNGSLPVPYYDLHLNDPFPPSNFSAYSDFQTPSSIVLSWSDPVISNDSLQLSNFKLHIYRDGNYIAEVDSGVQSFVDTGLTLHQLYLYTINTVVTSDSSLFDSTSAYSGGSAIPASVQFFSVRDDTDGVALVWTNPSTQTDGSPLNDIAYILLYRDGNVVDSVAQTVSDTGQQKFYYDVIQGYHTYKVQVRDNETPRNFSGVSEELSGYGGLLFAYDEDFEGDDAGVFRTGTWDTTHQIAYSGSRSMTDSPIGNYIQQTNTYCMLPPVVLGNEPILDYEDIAIVRAGSFVYVEISTNGRRTFTTLKVYNAYVQSKWLDGVANPGDWIHQTIDLTTYAGDTATIRFRIQTGTGTSWDGWFIDDIVIRDAGKIVTDVVEVTEGWNMISVPFKVTDRSVQSIFPTSVSPAFSYQKGYVRKDTFELATGYWLKFDSAVSVELTGSRNWKDTVMVTAGWNMIGALGSAIDSSTIVTSPSGIIQSSYFIFDTVNYIPVQTLQPAKAFWVKSKQNGKLIMTAPNLSNIK